MKEIIFTTVCAFVLSSCSLTLKTTMNPLGKRELEGSFTVAPLITVTRTDEFTEKSEKHTQKFFGVTPVPTTEKVTQKNHEKTVSETETTKATAL